MPKPRLTEEQIAEVTSWAERGFVHYGISNLGFGDAHQVIVDLLGALRQSRRDLKYQKELFEACAANLLSMQAERDVAREQVRRLREAVEAAADDFEYLSRQLDPPGGPDSGQRQHLRWLNIVVRSEDAARAALEASVEDPALGGEQEEAK